MLSKFNPSILLVIAALFSGEFAQAQVRRSHRADGAYLDPPYRERYRVRVNPAGRDQRLPGKSSTLQLMQFLTPVRAQGARGTCSIFSATAIFEAMAAIKGNQIGSKADYSEEYLEFYAMQGASVDGASAPQNFGNLIRYGIPTEAKFPYIGETWDNLTSSPLAARRCGSVPADLQKSCLLGHRDPRLARASDATVLSVDPEFGAARAEAAQIRVQSGLARTPGDFYLYTDDEIKLLLARGIPVLWEADFYYGAWNHGKAEELGIGRDLNGWAQGIVGYPERGSVDIVASPKKPAGHSVMLIGYDDTRQVTTTVKMQDGTVRKFTYTGVFYFKNSWGTGNFGAKNVIDGVRADGYGVVTQKYAVEYGSFYKLPLR